MKKPVFSTFSKLAIALLLALSVSACATKEDGEILMKTEANKKYATAQTDVLAKRVEALRPKVRNDKHLTNKLDLATKAITQARKAQEEAVSYRSSIKSLEEANQKNTISYTASVDGLRLQTQQHTIALQIAAKWITYVEQTLISRGENLDENGGDDNGGNDNGDGDGGGDF